MKSKIISGILIFSLIICILFISCWCFFMKKYYMDESDMATISAEMAILQTIATIVALIIAVLATFISVRKPKIDIIFLDQHGSVLELVNDKYIPLGISSSKKVGYLPYSPSDWEVIITNRGEKTAENIKIEIDIDGVGFEDKSNLYEVKDFIYGFGEYGKLVFDYRTSLTQGESIQIPKIPFQYANSEFHNNQITKIHIRIFCKDVEVKKIEHEIIIQEDDLVCDNQIDEVLYETDIINFINSFIENKCDGIDYYYDELNPYQIERSKKNSEYYRKIYTSYLHFRLTQYSSYPKSKKIIDELLHNKLRPQTLFWGRVYYRSLGYSKKQIELTIKNDLDCI